MHWFLKLLSIFFIVLLIWLVVSELIPKILPERSLSDKDLHGIIFLNQHWSGTIHITGDLITTPGVSVRVDPGTHIIVSKDGDRFNMDYLPWHLKSGLNTGETYHGVKNAELFWDESQKIQIHLNKFIALGTTQQPITITSNASPSEKLPFNFNVFSFNEGILSHIAASNYRRMEIGDKVTIRDSSFENTGDCSICIDGGSPSIINNTFKDGVREYIWDFGGSPRISDNLFLPTKGKGVVVDPDMDGALSLTHNDFETQGVEALDFLTGDEDIGGVISFNNFIGGSLIKIPCDSKVKFLENNIGSLISFQKGGCKQTLSFGPNYWGSADPKTVLSERILKQDSNLTVNIPSVLSTPPASVGIRH